jgi:hypothetical protein
MDTASRQAVLLLYPQHQPPPVSFEKWRDQLQAELSPNMLLLLVHHHYHLNDSLLLACFLNGL